MGQAGDLCICPEEGEREKRKEESHALYVRHRGQRHGRQVATYWGREL